MICSTNNPAQRKFFKRFAISMALYVLLLLVSVVAFVHFKPAGALAYVLAVLPALPIIAMLLAIGAYLAEEKDEFIRNMQVQMLLGGIGGTLSVVSVWGFLENFTRVRHMDLLWVYPLFWVCTGVSAAVVWLRYRS
jgi:multisubunit Na+/H+ antiporter MnhB subunit